MAKNGIRPLSLTLIRLAVGAVALYHGYGKLFMVGGFPGTVDFFTKVGIPMAKYAALASGGVEFFGGLFLVLGILTRWSSMLLIFNFVVAFSYVHWKNGFAVGAMGYEYVMVLIVMLIVILFNGPGKLALGKKIKGKMLQ